MTSSNTETAVRLPVLETVEGLARAVTEKRGAIASVEEALGYLEAEVRELAAAGKPTSTTRRIVDERGEELQDLRVQLDGLRSRHADALAREEQLALARDVSAFYTSTASVLRSRAEMLAAEETLAERQRAFEETVRQEHEKHRPGRGVDGNYGEFKRMVSGALAARGAVLTLPAGVLDDGGDTASEVRAEAERFASLAAGGAS